MIASLHAAEKGVGSKAIVLLHGFGGCHDIWREVIPALSPAVRTLAYDLPGHGLSLDFPGAGPAKLAARAVLADLTARSVKRVHLVGHSMGGAVAALMALAEPEKVASLTLLAPGGFGAEINGPLLRRFAAARDPSDIQACLSAMSGPQTRPIDHAVDALGDMRGRPGQVEKLIEIAAAMTSQDRQGVIPRDRLETLTMPVMVVWGSDDPMLPVAHTDNLPVQFHVHHVPGAGHMLIEEAPELIATIIRRNMNRRARPLRPN
ncbi:MULTISPECIES: alpha/beta fold hydrolase [unclassified Mesorhizobium]|uniref:alpha/beta fold hydrolase n=1 Tax=unclassified Mesorhizobium TaxID=325217 RepID=UPI001093EC78|nr:MULTISPECIES: alpha/beta fold hydrolase [unclassified Mesorhizobium]TIT65462.1 MAG: alpha/beta fold hydrolase [Mesorhizobium sp.]TGQ92158.1 alpha/beta fold hydrolase [Mesorhizobium sp. M8A.F.Ca.ET.208.01.1.1]TGT52058.1 alpha/beta fold hydrolase [Mesorhizobium sp. M8A.F.Ca.ET.167.01.1.1]TGT90828.1 alpha/beta fold hydrolase [Mesorhizobium sp. M8A.F.Ca.ET.161.01.1.1]TGV43892.1 alpha/beta fold hydrolase [Mesorhizobium sp. M8A.F.Ca.ET.142.01.1.1]